MTRLSLLLALPLVGASFAGCAPRASVSRSQAVSNADLAACRQRADEIYLKQNRAELYQSDTFETTNRDSPFATGGLTGVPTRGLSGRYARDTLLDECLAGTAAGRGAPVQTGPAPGPASGPTPSATLSGPASGR